MSNEINLCVVFTEFQLIQVESILTHYKLQNNYLILGENSRIQASLINHNLFEKIKVIPPYAQNGSLRKLLPNYLRHCFTLAKGIIGDKEINTFIGAADENTMFAVIKKLANAKNYYNIEDGLGNYRNFSIKSKCFILLKRLLFLIYGKPLNLAVQKGVVKATKKFRVSDRLSTSKNNLEIGTILRSYIESNKFRYKKLIADPLRFESKFFLIVTEKHPEIQEKLILNNSIIKPHPKYDIEEVSTDAYLLEKLPVEVVSILFPRACIIIYDSYFCSSILNLIVLCPNVMICLNFDVKKKYKRNKSIVNLGSMISELYHDRFITTHKLLEENKYTNL